MEAAHVYLHLAALIANYLRHKGAHTLGYSVFSKLAPNIDIDKDILSFPTPLSSHSDQDLDRDSMHLDLNLDLEPDQQCDNKLPSNMVLVFFLY